MLKCDDMKSKWLEDEDREREEKAEEEQGKWRYYIFKPGNQYSPLFLKPRLKEYI